MSEELKPCPFCASHELGRFCDPAEGSDNSGPSRRIQCYGCHVEAPFYDTEADAIAAWNRRSPAVDGGASAGAWADVVEWLKARDLYDHMHVDDTDLDGQTITALLDGYEARLKEALAEAHTAMLSASPAVGLGSSEQARIPTEQTDDPWAELERLALAATPGPWFQCGSPWFSEGSGVLAGSPDPHVGVMIVDTENWNGAREEAADGYDGKLADADEDAAFIAAANPATVLKLIAAARANSVGTEPQRGVVNQSHPLGEQEAVAWVSAYALGCLKDNGRAFIYPTKGSVVGSSQIALFASPQPVPAGEGEGPRFTGETVRQAWCAAFGIRASETWITLSDEARDAWRQMASILALRNHQEQGT